MDQELFYQLSLTLIPQIGCVQAKILLQHYEPIEIFKARRHELERIEGIGSVRARAIKEFTQFSRAEAEIKFIEKFRIKPLFISDKAYPRRLLNCYDSPTLLYYKGIADLNASRIVGIIGTRTHTEYGKQLVEKIVKDLAVQNVLVVSGLAFGIDALAHKASIKNAMPTVGVLGHGLDQIYPNEHASLAKDMLREAGGLLTEFRSGTNPDKHNFPTRNRIVAGMCDAIVVIETGVKGGSMITAELANGYNRDVFAFPGKTTDPKSSGCLSLIKNNKAMLISNGQELMETMGWMEKVGSREFGVRSQKSLFIEMTNEEKTVVDILRERGPVHIDEINQKSGLSSSMVAAAILNMELQGVVASMPGKLYRLN